MQFVAVFPLYKHMKSHSTESKIGRLARGIRKDVRAIERQWMHPVHRRYESEATLTGVRLANAIIGFMGSWAFLILQTIIVALWIAMNIMAWSKHFDPYPFILLNLAFSTQAAYAAPLILMAGNVAAAKDRELWESDYDTNQKAYEKIESLEEQIKAIGEQNRELLKLLIEVQTRENSGQTLDNAPEIL